MKPNEPTMTCNYSFIIPHTSNSESLKRCVDSIPERDDVEVIVVDKTKSVGQAMNIGLKRATGKWILLSLPSDFYSDYFLDVLDEYRDTDYDIVFFNYNTIKEKMHPSVSSSSTSIIKRIVTRTMTFISRIASFTTKILSSTTKTSSVSENDSRGSEPLNQYDKLFAKRDKEGIRYYNLCPWNRMIRRNFIDKYNISFEETGKDSINKYIRQIGSLAKDIKILNDKLYNYSSSVD